MFSCQSRMDQATSVQQYPRAIISAVQNKFQQFANIRTQATWKNWVSKGSSNLEYKTKTVSQEHETSLAIRFTATYSIQCILYTVYSLITAVSL